MGWLEITSAILTNTVKTLMAKDLDYCIISDMPGECGAGWNGVGQSSDKSLSQSHWNIPISVTCKVYVSTGLVKGSKDKSNAMIWNLREFANKAPKASCLAMR